MTHARFIATGTAEVIVALALACIPWAGAPAQSSTAAPEAPERHTSVAPDQVHTPIRIDRVKASGLGLAPMKSFVSGRSLSASTEYSGDQLSVRVMQANPTEPGNSTCLKMTNFPSDAVITVLNGRLVLTDAAGQRQEFVAGDVVVLPQGFTGTWEDFGVYRHLLVMAKGAPPHNVPCTPTTNAPTAR